ncbi:DUF6461 domain-containing protein [Streptomyces sp. NPDC046203]|uniref:DUF6461 domain-containing protein n=1 Tax=Streptomyces sp. NPDC046203 TaxID=3154602 RepID=UPI0034101AAF
MTAEHDGIQWLAGRDATSGIVFARGISATELAVRLGADPDGATEPIDDADAWDLGEWYRPGEEDDDGVIRVGEQNGWAFAVEYGDSTGTERLAEVSRDGVEALHFVPVAEHPPATVSYARDGVERCGFGLGEEIRRWGEEPDLLLPDLVAGGVLRPDGAMSAAQEADGLGEAAARRTLGVVERRFGLSLSPSVLRDACLPAYAVRGTPDMDV